MIRHAHHHIFHTHLLILLCAVLCGSCEIEQFPYYLARDELNVSIVLDRSSSMSGASISNAKNAAIAIVEIMNENDILSIVLFEDTGSVLVEAGFVTDKDEIIDAIEGIGAIGGTYVSAGLELGYAEIAENFDAGRENTCLLICDGDVDGGAATLAAEQYESGIRTSTIAVGAGADTAGLQAVSENGHGSSYTLTDSSELTQTFLDEINSLLSPIEM